MEHDAPAGALQGKIGYQYSAAAGLPMAAAGTFFGIKFAAMYQP